MVVDFTTQVLLQQQRDEIYLTGQMKLLKPAGVPRCGKGGRSF